MKRLLFILFIVIAIIALIAPVLFQEGNPLPFMSGIVSLSFGGEEVVMISEVPERYMTETQNGIASMIKMMEDEGWQFSEQLGSAYVFIKDNQSITLTSRQYTRKYMVWNFPV